jgi:hypothetical protein
MVAPIGGCRQICIDVVGRLCDAGSSILSMQGLRATKTEGRVGRAENYTEDASVLQAVME